MENKPTILPTTKPRSGGDTTYTLYELLQVAPDAGPAEIEIGYRRQYELYDPGHAAVMGDEFVAVARERRAALDDAFAVLGDPRRRFVYDRELGLVGDEIADRRGISNREVTFAVGGILVALLILAGLWYAIGARSSYLPAVSEVNYPAPPFDLRTVDGGRFDLAAQRGKVVLVNFWATYCEPCKEETPALQAAYTRLKDEGLVIVGVDLLNTERAQGRGEADVRQFAERYGVQYPIALDETGQVARDYKLSPIPGSYFIDPQGNVRYIRIGQLNRSDVEQLFRQLRQQPERAASEPGFKSQ